ncbi:hypothetical protein GW17_00009369, partial [Ensete ventricosum]
QLLSHHPHPFSFDGTRPSRLFKKGTASPTPCFGLGTSCWRRTTRRSPSHRIMADSTSGSRQVEVRRITKLNAPIIVYDPDERLNKLADEMDKNTGLSRLSLFSPCKVIIKALNLYRKKTGTDNFFWVNPYVSRQSLKLIFLQVVEDIPCPLPLDLPMVLIKPQEACSTAECLFLIYGPLRIKKCCFCFAEPPAFEVLPSLRRLKKRVLAAGRGLYDAVFMSGR